MRIQGVGYIAIDIHALRSGLIVMKPEWDVMQIQEPKKIRFVERSWIKELKYNKQKCLECIEKFLSVSLSLFFFHFL
jgi:hypothetical protein